MYAEQKGFKATRGNSFVKNQMITITKLKPTKLLNQSRPNDKPFFEITIPANSLIPLELACEITRQNLDLPLLDVSSLVTHALPQDEEFGAAELNAKIALMRDVTELEKAEAEEKKKATTTTDDDKMEEEDKDKDKAVEYDSDVSINSDDLEESSSEDEDDGGDDDGEEDDGDAEGDEDEDGEEDDTEGDVSVTEENEADVEMTDATTTKK